MKKQQRRKNERGFTLLEYVAGAAIITGIVWGSLNALGGSLSTMIGNVGTWADNRATDVSGS